MRQAIQPLQLAPQLNQQRHQLVIQQLVQAQQLQQAQLQPAQLQPAQQLKPAQQLPPLHLPQQGPQRRLEVQLRTLHPLRQVLTTVTSIFYVYKEHY